MKKITFFFSITFLITLISCRKLPEEPELMKEVTPSSEDLSYFSTTRYPDGSIKRTKLDGDQEIIGLKHALLFKGGTTVDFHENGEVSHGTLASGDQTLQIGSDANAKMITFKGSSIVNFHENGEVGHGTLASGDQTLATSRERCKCKNDNL